MPNNLGPTWYERGDPRNTPGYDPYAWNPTPMTGGGGVAAPPAPPSPLGLGPNDLRDGIQGIMPPGWESFRGPLGQSMDLASGLAGEENRRFGETSGFLKRQFEQMSLANRGMGQDEINQRMGRATDAATGQANDHWRTLRSQLGMAGDLGGGQAAGRGLGVELTRLAQIQGSKRDIAIAEAERRSQAATQNFQMAMGLGNFLNQSPSTIQLGQFNSLLDFGMNTTLGEKEVEAGKYAARQNRKAGKESGAMSMLGGLGNW